MRKTLSNLFYNSLYQVLILFIPLLTIPYVSRILGANGIGLNALVTSVANFLGTIIVMGMYQLGAREIAKSPQERLRAVFFSLWKIQLFSGIAVITVFVIFTTLFVKDNALFYFLEIPFLLSYALDISWFFVGIGQVKKVILRNTLVKFLSLGMIFGLVKAATDLWIYVFILSGSNFIANLMFLINLRGTLPSNKFGDYRVEKSYFSVALSLLLPQIALQLYTNFDDVIIGAISGNTQLAFYDQSQKVARIIVTILTSMSTVIMPKMASSKGDKELIRIFKWSLNYTLVGALFLSSLVMINSKNFVSWYYGEKFLDMADNMFWVSLIIIFISYGGVFSNQYMLAKGQFKKFSLPYYFGGGLNITLNLILVNFFSADGGTASLILTEFVICASRLYLTKNELNILRILKSQLKYFVVFFITISLGILFPVRVSSGYLPSIVLQSLISSFLFVSGLVVLKTEIAKDTGKLALKIVSKK